MAYIPAILILEMGRLKWRIPISESCSAMSILNVHNPVIYHDFFYQISPKLYPFQETGGEAGWSPSEFQK